MSSARKLQHALIQHVAVAAGDSVMGTEAAIAIGQDITPQEVIRLTAEQKFNHVVQKSGLEFDKEVLAASNLIENPDSFRNYPIACVFTPQDLNEDSERVLISAEEVFDGSHQKRAVLNSMVKAMDEKGFAQTLTEDVASVADELFTNAVFNAPFVDKTTFHNPGVSRQSLEVKMEPGKFGRLFLAHDETRLMIGCEDPYGSLSIDKFLRKIKATYEHGAAATMNFGPGGAGLGSYIIFNTGASMYAGVWPGQCTILCCVLPLGMSNRKRAALPKNIHLVKG